MAGNKEDLERPQVGYERTDVDTWAIGKFGIALVLICVASMGMLLMFFHYMIARDGPPPPKASSGLNREASKQPPAPQLEETPIRDLQAERAAEDRILNSYGWVDKQHGIVRIPIDKAIDLLAQKGLPARPGDGPQSAASGVSVPSESGLGPVMQQPGGPLAGGAK
jgi:hypothetical protein